MNKFNQFLINEINQNNTDRDKWLKALTDRQQTINKSIIKLKKEFAEVAGLILDIEKNTKQVDQLLNNLPQIKINKIP